MLIWVYTLAVLFMFGGIINVYFNNKAQEKLKELKSDKAEEPKLKKAE